MTVEMKAINKFRAAISEKYGFEMAHAQALADKALNQCPAVLLTNISEWSEGKPLSEIEIETYSVPMILAIWNSTDFLDALEVMKDLASGNKDIAEMKIWRMRG